MTQKTLTTGWTYYKPIIKNGSAASSSNAKAVRITKIGANISNNLSETRDFMVIPYSE